MAEELQRHYVRVSLLGSGSFGRALLMRRVCDSTLVVAKEIHYVNLKERDRRSALNEVDILQSLQHPNIVRYIEKFQDASRVYIIMEYCDQGDLAQRIAERKGARFSEDEVLDYFAQLCLALRYLHEHRILHRDLKSQNVFLTSSGVVKLGDFGISAVLRNTFELRMTVCGTPYYFSPELCQNKPYNNKSDVWALGCILYELLTLRRPFTGSNMTSLAQRIRKGEYVPIDAAHYSPMLVKLVAAMLHTDPHERPTVSQIFGLQMMKAAMARLRARLDATATAAAAARARYGNASMSSNNCNTDGSSSNNERNGSGNRGENNKNNGSDGNAAVAAAPTNGHGMVAHDDSRCKCNDGNERAAAVVVPCHGCNNNNNNTPAPVLVACMPNVVCDDGRATSKARVPTTASSSPPPPHAAAAAPSVAHDAAAAAGATRKQREQLRRQFVHVAAYAQGLSLEQFSALDASAQVRVVCAAINARKAAEHAQWEQRAAAAQREREKELQQSLSSPQQQSSPSSPSPSDKRTSQAAGKPLHLPSSSHGGDSSASNATSGDSSSSSCSSHSIRSRSSSSSISSSSSNCDSDSHGAAAKGDDAPLPRHTRSSSSGRRGSRGSDDDATSGQTASGTSATALSASRSTAAAAGVVATTRAQAQALHVVARTPAAAAPPPARQATAVAVPATHAYADPHSTQRAPAPPRTSSATTAATAARADAMPLMHCIELLRVELERAMGEEQLARCYQALRAAQSAHATTAVAAKAPVLDMPAAWQRFVPRVQQLIAYEHAFDCGGRGV